jgi:hypothetical protein
MKEIVDLDRKLRESHPGVQLPVFPVDVHSLPPPPPKRKSTFLNTLSRLASPTSSKIARSSSTRRFTNPSAVSPGATPLTSPSGELSDPFSSFTASNLNSSDIPHPSVNSTAIAAYLTTISNIVALRQARVWKRFVRVRTDDLESVRVERAIKRVRSDLAAHAGLVKEKESVHVGTMQDGHSVALSESQSILDHRISLNESHEACEDVGTIGDEETKEEEEGSHAVPNGDLVMNDLEASHTAPELPDHEPDFIKPTGDGTDPAMAVAEESLTTPVTSEPPSRIPRSHSADFDKSSRLSRTYSAPSQDTSSQTGDESSASTTGGSRRRSGRKKRSLSMAPKKSHRKVNIDDFEMMRVLGKGCAGKVLLVRHKATTDLYALKAITKRHVLAHQELQHTLTEQAVLKRMAAESRDPFVVKLWWSFHDKENLFLVMVRIQQ